MAHNDKLLFSAYLQSGTALLHSQADPSGSPDTNNYNSLKGRFHQFTGAIDFHLSMHREKKSVKTQITCWLT